MKSIEIQIKSKLRITNTIEISKKLKIGKRKNEKIRFPLRPRKKKKLSQSFFNETKSKSCNYHLDKSSYQSHLSHLKF